MTTNNVVLLYKPYKFVVEAGLRPKTLIFKDHSGEVHYYEPEFIKNEIRYTVCEAYARKLLTDSRYLLISPDRMVISYFDKKKWGTITKVISAVKKTTKKVKEDDPPPPKKNNPPPPKKDDSEDLF